MNHRIKAKTDAKRDSRRDDVAKINLIIYNLLFSKIQQQNQPAPFVASICIAK